MAAMNKNLFQSFGIKGFIIILNNRTSVKNRIDFFPIVISFECFDLSKHFMFA